MSSPRKVAFAKSEKSKINACVPVTRTVFGNHVCELPPSTTSVVFLSLCACGFDCAVLSCANVSTNHHDDCARKSMCVSEHTTGLMSDLCIKPLATDPCARGDQALRWPSQATNCAHGPHTIVWRRATRPQKEALASQSLQSQPPSDTSLLAACRLGQSTGLHTALIEPVRLSELPEASWWRTKPSLAH